MNNYKKIYQIVKRIPKGKVATYGQVAELAGIPRQARQVGYALSSLTDKSVPWHRVVNSKGEISRRALGDFEDLQRVRLEKEGVEFDKENKIPLGRFGWNEKADG